MYACSDSCSVLGYILLYGCDEVISGGGGGSHIIIGLWLIGDEYLKINAKILVHLQYDNYVSLN
jgi:hypothetical protein